ncbi:S-layer homology domain-containing protein [Sporomusa sp.]|uniref:S-layer homology domain-containing protein n=1 Tax=Sporomusa sp. TaxID=2078658 RepID=UPI002D1DFCDB|nr:S-layer homology domain-containing protein [Sporomusa sp.]HWR08845.1 S-layer homology domain-containing protein [Sporomusa sp.]
MKNNKKIALAFAAAFTLSLAGTALATPNPFSDIPAKHWAYDSINKLAKAGVVSGYGDNTFKGDKTLTRYEVAVIVAKAMSNTDKIDAETKSVLDRLQMEFSSELNNLGVRVDEIEKKTDNLKFSGNIRARYDNNERNDGSKETLEKLRTRLMLTGKINDSWSYNGRLQNIQDIKTGGSEGETVLNIANVSGKIGGATLTLGRYSILPVYGMVIDDQVDGAMVSFGNKMKVDLAGYKFDSKVTNNETILMASLAYAANNKLDLAGAYYHYDDSDKNIYEAGFAYKLNKDFTVTASYTKEDVDKNDSYYTKLAYKGANKSREGSYGVYATYRDVKKGTYIAPTYDQDFISLTKDTSTGDGKGYEVAFTYTPVKNLLLTTSYTDLEGATDKTKDSQYYRAQLEFFF